MNCRFKSAVAVSALLLLGCSGHQIENAPPPDSPAMRAFDPESIDRSIDPCDNFYKFACGGWEAAHPRPSTVGAWSRPWGHYADSVDRFNRALIEFVSKYPEPGNIDQKNLSQFLQACTDIDSIDARGMDPFASRFGLIDTMGSAKDVGRVLGELTATFGANTGDPFLELYSWGDPIEGGARRRGFVTAADGGLPSREYYERESDDADDVLSAYSRYIVSMLDLAGYDLESRERLADQIIAMEARLQQARRSAAEERNDAQAEKNLMMIHELGASFSNVDWNGLFEARSFPIDDALVVPDPGYLKELDAWIVDANIEVLRAYFKIFAMRDVYFALPAAGRDAAFALYGETLGGLEEPWPRWQICVAAAESALPEALGRQFVAATLGPGIEDQSERVFSSIRAAMELRIKTADWLRPETKQAALAKLSATRISLAQPDIWLDDRSIEVDKNDLVATFARFGASKRLRGAQAIGQPLDINEWAYPTTRVIGFYSSSTNTIFMAAAQLAYFGAETNDPAVLYGGLGVFLAHELLHGFDSHGSQYDGAGRVRNWWTVNDRTEFDDRAQCIIDEANELSYPSGDAVNGELVVSEHAAEIISVGLALQALEATDTPDNIVAGYTPLQRFFITNGQMLCYQATDEAWRQMANSDSHLWGPSGVNSVVRNNRAFAKAFSCPTGAPMTKRPEDICRIW